MEDTMKKLLLVLVAVLLLTGTVYAAGIPTAVSPKTAPEVWTQEVYNDSASALTSGTVVVWDYAGDTTDADFAYRTMWVEASAASAELITTAGVVIDSSIPAYTEGTIAIYGPVYVRCSDSGDAVAALDEVGTSATAAGTAGHAATASGGAVLGWALSSSPVAVEYGGYGGTAANNNVMIPIFVNISVLPGA
jgi:hypothetical protein